MGKVSGFYSSKAWVEIRVLKTDENRVVAAHSLHASALGLTPDVANKKALSLVGNSMADYIVERLVEFRNPNEIKTIRLTINGLKNESQLDELKEAIIKMLLVVDAKVNFFNENKNKGELIVKTLGNNQQLTEDLNNLSFINLIAKGVDKSTIQAMVK